MKEAVCGYCGNKGPVADDVVHVACNNCGKPVYWRDCSKCGTKHCVSMGLEVWKCTSCKKRNNESILDFRAQALLGGQTVVYGPERRFSAIGFHHWGVLLGQVGTMAPYTFLPWYMIENFSVDGSADFQRRITATRMVGLGLFALAAPKTTLAGLTFMTFNTTEGQDYI